MNSNRIDCAFLTQMKAFFFDLDGCLYFYDQVAPGAIELLNQLQLDGKQILFLTNNSTQTTMEVSTRLNQLGIPALPKQVLTATDSIGNYLREKWGKSTVKVIGSESLALALQCAGHRIIPLHSTESCKFLIVGRDTEFTYNKLQMAAAEQQKGAVIWAANPDYYHPGANGEKIPETGSLIAALEAMTGVPIEFVGKPASYMFLRGLEICGTSPGECVMIGDNLTTDIAGGLNAGLQTVWMQGSQPNLLSTNERHHPHLIVTDAAELLVLYQKRPS